MRRSHRLVNMFGMHLHAAYGCTSITRYLCPPAGHQGELHARAMREGCIFRKHAVQHVLQTYGRTFLANGRMLFAGTIVRHASQAPAPAEPVEGAVEGAVENSPAQAPAPAQRSQPAAARPRVSRHLPLSLRRREGAPGVAWCERLGTAKRCGHEKQSKTCITREAIANLHYLTPGNAKALPGVSRQAAPRTRSRARRTSSVSASVHGTSGAERRSWRAPSASPAQSVRAGTLGALPAP